MSNLLNSNTILTIFFIKVYTGVNYGNTYFNRSEFARFPLWIANWGVSKPGIPGKWTSYVYW